MQQAAILSPSGLQRSRDSPPGVEDIFLWTVLPIILRSRANLLTPGSAEWEGRGGVVASVRAAHRCALPFLIRQTSETGCGGAREDLPHGRMQLAT